MSKKITVRAVIINNNEIVLLLRRKLKKGKLLEYYALPGGHLEKDETKEECVIREIKEELNINIDIKDFLGIVEKKNKIDYIYKCEWLSGDLLLGGEEKEQNNPNNYYEIQRISIEDLDNINIYPENFTIIKKALRKE